MLGKLICILETVHSAPGVLPQTIYWVMWKPSSFETQTQNKKCPESISWLRYK